MLNCSVVVPVYNSAEMLPVLVRRLSEVLPTLSKNFELILVDDGSHDQSWQTIKELSKQHPWVRGIHLMRNFGQHNALITGIRAARYEITVTMDDDLQNPPEEIDKLLQHLEQGHDVVYGVPQAQQHGLFRNFASSSTKWVLRNAMGAKTAQDVSAFRAFRTELRKAFEHYEGPYVSIDVLLTWGSLRFSAVPVRQDTRLQGVSNYTFRKLVIHSLNMITGFTTVPLQLASWVGFGFTIFGFIVLVYVVGRYLIQGGSVPGFPFLASTIAVFSGAQLFALGIIGEYLARMYFRSMGRPTSVIQETIGFQDKSEG